MGATKCGDQPTREEILQDNINPDYAQFQSDADIDKVCTDLEAAYKVTVLKDYDWTSPSTIGLCERQTLVKHLCPGYCDGGCFDEEMYPPSCDPEAYQGPVNDTLDAWHVCDLIG